MASSIILGALALAGQTLAQGTYQNTGIPRGFPDCQNGPLANTTVCNVNADPLSRATALINMFTLDEKFANMVSFLLFGVEDVCLTYHRALSRLVLLVLVFQPTHGGRRLSTVWPPPQEPTFPLLETTPLRPRSHSQS